MGKRQPFQLMVLGKLDSYMLKKKNKRGSLKLFFNESFILWLLERFKHLFSQRSYDSHCMNYWEISEAFLKIPPCLDQISVQVAEIEKKMAV